MKVGPRHEQAVGRERHRRLDPTKVAWEDVFSLARQRAGVVQVPADRASRTAPRSSLAAAT
jgi:hypothetical protein